MHALLGAPPWVYTAGLRGGNFEWRFHLQVGAGSWRVIHPCDAWPLDAVPETADGAEPA